MDLWKEISCNSEAEITLVTEGEETGQLNRTQTFAKVMKCLPRENADWFS